MKKSDELKQLRAGKIEAANTLIEKVETEKREFSAEEKTQFDALKTETRNFDAQIAHAESIEEMQARKAAGAMAGGAGARAAIDPETREYANFSLVKAVREMTQGGVTGFEREVMEEGIKEARKSGIAVSGFAVPNKAWGARAAIAATSNDAIADDAGGFIDALRKKTRVLQMGAQFIPGLVGDYRPPKMTAAGGLTWEGEGDTNAESGAAISGIVMSPKRGSAYTDVSKQFLNQTAFGAEAMLRNDLIQAVAVGLDAAAINGSSLAPTGILNMAGITTVAMGTNGLAPTWAKIVELESSVDTSNALDGTLGYLTTAGMRGKLKTVARDAGSGIFLWNGTELNGYPAFSSNNVPSTLVKGSSGAICHAIIFGDFSQLIVGQWGVIDLVVDPYTLASKAEVRLTVNVFADVKARHEAAFAAIKDALV